MVYDKLIIGGGVVGLATALALKEKDPDCSLAILEKERSWAEHQSGRNSGVIHAGVYYKPGSKKAKFALAGNKSMYRFCQENDIPHERCGKLIVATNEEQLPALQALFERAQENGLEVVQLAAEAAREIEPHVSCIAALHVPSTGIVDYKVVASKYAQLLSSKGVDMLLDSEVTGLKENSQGFIVATKNNIFETKYLVSSVGLFSDRMARNAGVDPGMKIVPFRGEYWHLNQNKRHLVKNLIYPVPNPNFPFLGVHLTRLIDGSIHAGPNAVLAFSREGYTWSKINFQDLSETLLYKGFWKLASQYIGEGSKEIYRSLVKSAFLRSIQEIIPDIQSDDLVRGASGVRAQGLLADGGLVDDFSLLKRENALFVLNAPSPAATASIEIGKYIARIIK